MPEGSNSISASFGLDLAPLKRDFAQAATIAKTGSAQVASAMKTSMASATSAAGQSGAGRNAYVNWAAVSAARGNMARPGYRTAADFLPAPPGKYPSPAQQEAEERGGAGRDSRSAFGIAGLGRAFTAIYAVRQLGDMFSKANEEAEKLRETVIKIGGATGGSAFRGIAEMTSNLKDAGETLNQIRQRDLAESGGGGGFFSRMLGGAVRGTRHLMTGGSDTDDEEQKKRIREGAIRSISDMADKQRELNTAQDEEMHGSTRNADLLKARAASRERLGNLAAEEAKAGVTNNAARKEEMRNQSLIEESINRKADTKDRELATEEAIAKIKSLQLPKEKEALQVAIKRRNNLEFTRSVEGNAERRAELTPRIIEAQTAVREAQFAAADQSPGAVQSRNAANLENLRTQAFNTNMAQMEDPTRAAYGAQVSGLGAVGPQTAGGKSATAGTTATDPLSSMASDISAIKDSLDTLVNGD